MPDTPSENIRLRSRLADRWHPRKAAHPERDVAALAYEAFCATHRPVYSLYAAARLGSDRLGDEATGAALNALVPMWSSALTCAAPASVSWLLLTAAVDARSRPGCDPVAGLPRLQTDAVILRNQLGLPSRVAAAAMGLPLSEFAMVYSAALRASPQNS